MPKHGLVHVSEGRQRQIRALAKGLQRVPSWIGYTKLYRKDEVMVFS